MTAFAEFGAATNFSFLRGASHPEEMVAMAHALGMRGLGIADRNSVAGVVRAYSYAKERLADAEDFRVVSGARLVFADGTPDMLAYPRDREAWGRLTRLLTIGNARSEKGTCTLFATDLPRFAEGLQLIVMATSTVEAPAGSGKAVWPQLGEAIAEAAENVLVFPPGDPPHPDGPPDREKAFIPQSGDASNVLPFKGSDLLPLEGDGGAERRVGQAPRRRGRRPIRPGDAGPPSPSAGTRRLACRRRSSGFVQGASCRRGPPVDRRDGRLRPRPAGAAGGPRRLRQGQRPAPDRRQ